MTHQVPIVVPSAGFEDQPITVGLWRVEIGGTVSDGDPIVELIAPGILYVVTAPQSGKVVSHLASPGKRVSEGGHLGMLQPGSDS